MENSYAILNANQIWIHAINEGQKSNYFFADLLPFDLENIIREALEFSFWTVEGTIMISEVY